MKKTIVYTDVCCPEVELRVSPNGHIFSIFIHGDETGVFTCHGDQDEAANDFFVEYIGEAL